MGFIGEIIGGIIGAVISGGIAIYISQKSIKEERKERDNEKLQDRKQLWLKKHYEYIQTNIMGLIKTVHIKTSMIHNGASNIVIGREFQNGIPKISISNNLKPIMECDLQGHLKSYPWYDDAAELYKTVDIYNNDLINLYNNFVDYVQNEVNKHFKMIIPVENIPSNYQGYYMEQIFKAAMYHIFQKSDFKIYNNTDQNGLKYFSFNYKVEGSYHGMFFSNDEKNIKIFEESIMNNIISKFKDDFMNIEEKNNEIDTKLKNLIQELLKVSSSYNSGFAIEGECEDCKQIKSVNKLDKLMPPN